MSKKRGFRNINLNGIDNNDCPCKKCETHYASCHSKCLDYIDWKQLHEAKLQEVRDQRKMRDVYYEGCLRRGESLGRRALNIGRKKKRTRGTDTSNGT